MDLAGLGEFGFIDRIRRVLGKAPGDVVVGPGDDTAAFRMASGRFGLLTADALVEGVHFDPSYTPWEALGWKALAVNLSDIAAMGGIPRYAVVSIAAPGSLRVDDAVAFYRGMRRCSDAYGCVVIGGDTVRSRADMMVSVTVLGEVEEDRMVRRAGAEAGDLLLVTGSLGGARVGLAALSSGNTRYPKSVRRFLQPCPRVTEARILVESLRPSAMIDISDGLASEIGHLCRESGVGCVVREEGIPVFEEARAWAEREDLPSQELALNSGEEYELLFTADPASYDAWLHTRSEGIGIPVAVLGEITPKERGIRIRRGGRESTLRAEGWDHFSG